MGQSMAGGETGVGGTRLAGLCVSHVRIYNLQAAKPVLWEQANRRVSNRRVIE